MLAVALSLSAVAAFYSIIGLAAIFAAAVIPIVIMGSILEVAKLTVTVWLHEYWQKARWLMKAYLCVAVVVLMTITSMGIFGFLSKAHSDQSMVSGDVLAKIAIYDEKIKTAKENIDANRKALKQMDEAVDQVMARSTSETGADKAVAVRRAQQKERGRLLAEIDAYQKTVSGLNEERSPIAAEVRKVEAEVGPIKYIAALVYGDNPDANLLERAVRWVIIMLVVVFDPLAVMMLLAATESRKWNTENKSKYEPDDGPLTEEQIDQLKATVKQSSDPTSTDWKIRVDPSPPGWMYNTTTTTYPSTEEEVEEIVQEFDRTRHAYLDKPFVHFENLKPMVASKDEPGMNIVAEPTGVEIRPFTAEEIVALDLEDDDDLDDTNDPSVVRQAKKLWKEANPDMTLKDQRQLLARGVLDQEPWMDYLDDPRIQRDCDFGESFPTQAHRGDMFVLTSVMPTSLFKYTGEKWIAIDKTFTDQYIYNEQYIDHLIARVGNGSYDPDLLTDAEQAQISSKLNREI